MMKNILQNVDSITYDVVKNIFFGIPCVVFAAFFLPLYK